MREWQCHKVRGRDHNLVYDCIQERIWVVYWNLKLENFIKEGGKRIQKQNKKKGGQIFHGQTGCIRNVGRTQPLLEQVKEQTVFSRQTASTRIRRMGNLQRRDRGYQKFCWWLTITSRELGKSGLVLGEGKENRSEMGKNRNPCEL